MSNKPLIKSSTVSLGLKENNIYAKAYCRVLGEYEKAVEEGIEQDWGSMVRKLVIYGVKAINAEERPEIIVRSVVQAKINFISVLYQSMSLLTPKEFMNMFPVAKEYDGHKYGIKDYFYTIEHLKAYNPNEPIGERIMDFLWDYQNWELARFSAESMTCISQLRRLDGELSVIEEWAFENGIKTYALHTDSKGKKYMLDNETGKTMRVREKSHLKLVR